MQIMERIKKITRPPFQLEPEKYVIGYEDKDNPCYICILKGMCTAFCKDIYDYKKEIQKDMNRLGRKWAQVRFKPALSSSVSYSISNVMEVLKSIKGSVAEDMFYDDEMHESIQRAQYHLNRKRIIQRNYVNKYGRDGVSSSTQSGVSSSSVSPQPTQPKKRRTYGTNPAKTNAIPGLNKGQGSRKHIRPRNY